MKIDFKNTVIFIVAIVAIISICSFFAIFAEETFSSNKIESTESVTTSDSYECQHEVNYKTCQCELCGNFYHSFTDAYSGCGPNGYYACVRCGEISDIEVPHTDTDKDGVCNYCGHDLIE